MNFRVKQSKPLSRVLLKALNGLLSNLMGFEMLFILGLALLVFGPKKLPQISRQIGKLVGEFRRASQEFKMQIEEEVRNLEIQAERDSRAKAQAQSEAESKRQAMPQIMPPSVGETVSMRRTDNRDTSFDSAETNNTGAGLTPAQEENAEAMKGQNA